MPVRDRPRIAALCASIVAPVLVVPIACAPDEDKPYQPPGHSGSGPPDEVGTSNADGTSGSSSGGTTGGPVPTDYNYAFVSSATYVPGDLGGAEQADAACQALADAAGLAGTYVAWLSTTTVDAKSRLAGARGWVRPDGRPFVDDVTDLINVDTLYPLRIDEWGQDLEDVLVVTGTDPSGVGLIDADHGTCEDWTSADAAPSASGGVSDAGDALWTSWASLSFGCDAPAHLYCFGTDVSVPLDFEPSTGRVAFVTATSLVPSVGIDAADALCAQEAGMAGLNGTFVALMATDTAAASERLDLGGDRWVRPDGVQLVENASDLPNGLLAPLVREADQFVASPRLVWTGAGDLDMVSALESCSSWTSLVGDARAGLSSRSVVTWFASQSLGCDADDGFVYCFEN